MRLRLAGLILAILIIGAAGCGTIDADVQLHFTSDSKVRSQLTMSGTGALGNMLASGDNAFTNFDRTVWDISRDVRDGSVILIASTKAPLPVEEQPLFRGQNDQFRNASWTVGGNPFVRSYHFSMDMKMAPIEPPQQNAFLNAQAMNNMADAAFKMTIAVTMPGQITATNADSRIENTAKWLMNYSGMVAGKTLSVDSQEIMWANIGGSAVALVGIVGGGAWLRTRGRKTEPPTPEQDRARDEEPATGP